jgi:hypothetical protein
MQVPGHRIWPEIKHFRGFTGLEICSGMFRNVWDYGMGKGRG